MSDDLREEVTRLRERVVELEDRLDAAGPGQPDFDTTAEPSGLDHRDKTVLAFMRENGKRSKRRLVKLYISKTDIQDRKIAKRRAKTLEQTEVYRNL